MFWGLHEQLAIAAFFLRASKLGFRTSVLSSLEVKIGQVEEHQPVGYIEQTVSTAAKMVFQLVFQLIQG